MLQSLHHPRFARLYAAQVINLTGDAFTWLGLGLLAYELVGDGTSQVLALALTLRVTIYALLSPLAGVIADRVDRRGILVATHILRAVLVALLPGVNQLWQFYGLVAAINLGAAFFTPTYTATIPLVVNEIDRPGAIALSTLTYQILGVFGPGLAGIAAAGLGPRTLFWLDSATFIGAAAIIMGLPGVLHSPPIPVTKPAGIIDELGVGSRCLWRDPWLRYALLMQGVAALGGAAILVNTVGYVQGLLRLGRAEYGGMMAALGLGAALAAVLWHRIHARYHPLGLLGGGVASLALALLPANYSPGLALVLWWAIAGLGQSLVNITTQALIAERVATELQGRVYGAQFAWSHLWWVLAYPLAGWSGQHWPGQVFSISGLGTLVLLGTIYGGWRPRSAVALLRGQWHEHEHTHGSEGNPDHHHPHGTPKSVLHHHVHFHPAV